MSRTYILLLFQIIFCTFSYSQETAVMGFDYSQFRSYFSDKYYDSAHGLELPRNAFTQSLYLTNEPEEKLYAIGLIKNNDKDELFIVHRIMKDQNLDYSSIVVFRDGKPLSKELNEIIIENAPDSDGGIFNQFYEIENNIIIANAFWSECCSSTGYNTPIAVKAVVDFKIDDTGKAVVQSVDTCLFSSRFFDVDYLQTLIKNGEQYPTKDVPHILSVNNWTKSIESLYSNNIELSFYIELIDSMLSAILISKDKSGNIIDTYRVGKGSAHLNKKDNLFTDTIFKNPIIIKTSKRDIRLFPDGSFR